MLRPFPDFVLRTPLFPFSKFIAYLNSTETPLDFIVQVMSDSLMNEALLIASPALHSSLTELSGKAGEHATPKKVNKAYNSLLKYLARACCRGTPFGLFAGITTGRIDKETNTNFETSDRYRRKVKLDMEFYFNLIEHIESIKEVKHTIRYRSNNSIYKVGNSIRYIEYTIYGKRKYFSFSKADSNRHLSRLIQHAKKWASYDSMLRMLIEDGFEESESSAYINQLIDNKILVSELSPDITSDKNLHFLRDALKRIIPESALCISLILIGDKLDRLNQTPPGTSVELYDQINGEVKKLDLPFSCSNIFHVDLTVDAGDCRFSEHLVNEASECIPLLAGMTSANYSMLDDFKKRFNERYESREVPLLEALDPEVGLNFNYSVNRNSSDPLLDSLKIKPKGNKEKIFLDEGFLPVLNEVFKPHTENTRSIFLTHNIRQDRDKDLPRTMSMMLEGFDNYGDTLVLRSVGGTGAANLISRFGFNHEKLNRHLQNIADKEEELTEPGQVIAELIHLPESRVGNVLIRPVHSRYEINCLTFSRTESRISIGLDDLNVRMRNGRMQLISKSLNKEVIPRLSTAHNFNLDCIPVYQFLCSLQYENHSTGLNFDWRGLQNTVSFLPRVSYKNIIISCARWNIGQELRDLAAERSMTAETMSKLKTIMASMSLDRFISLRKDEDGIFIDLHNTKSVGLFLSLIGSGNSYFIEEWPFFTGSDTFPGSSSHLNQFIFSFHKKQGPLF